MRRKPATSSKEWQHTPLLLLLLPRSSQVLSPLIHAVVSSQGVILQIPERCQCRLGRGASLGIYDRSLGLSGASAPHDYSPASAPCLELGPWPSLLLLHQGHHATDDLNSGGFSGSGAPPAALQRVRKDFAERYGQSILLLCLTLPLLSSSFFSPPFNRLRPPAPLD